MKKIVLLLAVISAMVSCKTDFDTIAPYKEVMVVYGLLNPNDTIQYVRIGKAYLGEGNALIMAQQSDSINYADVLEVTLDRIQNGNVISYPALTRDTMPKDDGTFSGVNIVYSFPHRIDTTGSEYKLTVHNTKTGLIVSSTTGIVENTTNDNGYSGIETPVTSLLVKFADPGQLLIKFKPDRLAAAYNVALRFYYKDSASSVYEIKSFDWDLGDQVVANANSDITYSPTKRDFFSVAMANILPDNDKWRHIETNFDIVITGITQETYTYITLTNPSAGITQDHPFYSNIENGVGLFSSRNNKRMTGYNMKSIPADTLRANIPGINWY
jgi:hypothetical protein